MFFVPVSTKYLTMFQKLRRGVSNFNIVSDCCYPDEHHHRIIFNKLQERFFLLCGYLWGYTEEQNLENL